MGIEGARGVAALARFFFSGVLPVAFFLPGKVERLKVAWVGDLTKVEVGFQRFRKRRKWPVTWPTDWEAPGHERSHCSTHLWVTFVAQIDDWLLHLVLVAGFFWVACGTEVLYINISTPCYMWLKCRFKHILKTLGCQLRIWSGQTCWATCWPIPKLTLTYILSPWKFEKTSLPKVLDLDVKNKASKKGEYQQISSQGNRNMDT